LVGAIAAPTAVTALGGDVACASTALHVAVVIDRGTGSTVSAVCVTAGASDSGAVVLATRARMLGLPQPVYRNDGILCSIDGFPANGCAATTDHSYWSYWHGATGSWSYSNIGPATSRVDASVVEGWRWQPTGSANASDPPPRASANAIAICVPVPPPPHPLTTTTAAVRAAADTPVRTSSRTSVESPAHASGSTPRSTVVTTAPTRAHATHTFAPEHAQPSTTVLSKGAVAAAVPVRGTTSSSGGAPVGLTIGLVLVGALGAIGAVAARRRRTAS
jgi:hypothetical protein